MEDAESQSEIKKKKLIWKLMSMRKISYQKAPVAIFETYCEQLLIFLILFDVYH